MSCHTHHIVVKTAVLMESTEQTAISLLVIDSIANNQHFIRQKEYYPNEATETFPNRLISALRNRYIL